MKELILLALLVAITACTQFAPSSNPAASACITSAGYSWCEKEGRCVRPWELVREKNLGNTKDSFENYCTPTPPIGGVQDEHGCIGSAGYSWCEAEQACVRPWELARQMNLDGSKLGFDQYCNGAKSQLGGGSDNHGCVTSAGYSWCEAENACVRTWELARSKNLHFSGIASYCAGQTTPPIGGVKDEHGCIGSAGYRWCEAENACVRPWELARSKNLQLAGIDSYCAGLIPTPSTPIGGVKDEHGCIGSAGYRWCEAENSCVRPWELANSKNLQLSNIDSYCAGQTTPPIGGVQDEHGCIASAGYSWCEAEKACVRPWELVRMKNLGAGKEAFDAYCASTPSTPPIGGVQDEHGCIASAGYSWCEALKECVRPWELANLQGLDGTKVSFDQYCGNPQPIGADLDEHGCIASAGYSWCEAEQACVRPWEVANLQGLDGTKVSFDQYCGNAPRPSQPIGADQDEHNCIASAGYSWCEAEQACVRPWELVRTKNLGAGKQAFEAYCTGARAKIGSDRDNHGCVGSAGYKWCAPEQKCVRVWELAQQKGLQLAEAQAYCA